MYQDKNGIRYYNDYSSSDEGKEGEKVKDAEEEKAKTQFDQEYYVVDATEHQVPITEIFNQDDLEMINEVSFLFLLFSIL